MNVRLSVEKFLLIIVLTVGAILRFYNYGGWSLSNDELSALSRLRYSGFFEMIENGVKLNDMHPLGVQSFLYVLTHLFGTSEAVVRLPFVLMGIASMYVFFLIGKNWFNTNLSLLATTVFSFLEFPILYSQLARPYSPGLLFSLLAVYYWTKIIQHDSVNLKQKKLIKNYAGFILSSVGCMYTHYFSFMFVGIVGLCGLFLIQRSQLKWYLLSGVLMFVLYLPSIKIFIYHFSIGGLGGEGGWLGPPKSDAIWTYIKYCFNNSFLLIFIMAAVLIISVITKKGSIPFSKYQLLSLLFFFVPSLIAYFYSIYKNPVFQYSILLFSFPYLLLFVFSFLPSFQWKPLVISMWALLFSIGVYSTVVAEKFYSTQHFGVFKELVEKTIEYDKKFGVGNITHTVNVITPYYITYYSDKLHQQSNFLQYSTSKPGELNQLDSIVQQSNTPYFLHGWSNTYDPTEVEQIIMLKYPVIIERNNFFNSGITLYANESQQTQGQPIKPLFELTHDFETLSWEHDSLFRTQTEVHNGGYAAHFDKDHEYSPTFNATLNDIHFRKGCVIQLSVWINALKTPLDANLVLSIDDNDKNILWRGVNAKDFITMKNKWQHLYLSYKINEDFSGNEKVKVYVWNSGKGDFYFDDLRIKVMP